MPIAQTHTDDTHLLELRPNCSLSWVATKRIFLGFTLLFAFAAAYWASIGAWLVLPFFGLELGVLGLGLYLSALAGSEREQIRIEADRLVLLRGRKDLQPRVELSRYWTRVSLVRDPSGWYPNRLLLQSHGHCYEVASRLVEDERSEVFAELERLVGFAAPQPANDRPFPTDALPQPTRQAAPGGFRQESLNQKTKHHQNENQPWQ